MSHRECVTMGVDLALGKGAFLGLGFVRNGLISGDVIPGIGPSDCSNFYDDRFKALAYQVRMKAIRCRADIVVIEYPAAPAHVSTGLFRLLGAVEYALQDADIPTCLIYTVTERSLLLGKRPPLQKGEKRARWAKEDTIAEMERRGFVHFSHDAVEAAARALLAYEALVNKTLISPFHQIVRELARAH